MHQNRGKGYTDAITAHNPKIKYLDGKYYLYYISTNLDGLDYDNARLKKISHTGYSHELWKVLRENQRTFVAVSNSINGPWERPEKVLIEPSDPIKNGERIRQYKVEALVNGKWQTVCDGQSVGNKRIQDFDIINTNKLRLIIDKSIANPLIKDFSVYYVE